MENQQDNSNTNKLISHHLTEIKRQTIKNTEKGLEEFEKIQSELKDKKLTTQMRDCKEAELIKQGLRLDYNNYLLDTFLDYIKNCRRITKLHVSQDDLDVVFERK